MITSATSSAQIYNINQVTKTRATSAYTKTSPTSPISRMEQMQEKYKNVYSPMPASYSKEREDLQLEKIREVYPDFLPFNEMVQEFGLMSVDPTKEESIEDKKIREIHNKDFIQSMGGEETYKESLILVHDVRIKYPNNIWSNDNFNASNSKELSNFYNAAIYEGLEKGKDLKAATNAAQYATTNYNDTSEYAKYEVENTLKNIDAKKYELTKEEIELAKQTNYQELSYDINLKDYGFNEQWNQSEKPEQSNKIMISRVEKKLELYDFMLNNPDIIEQQFQKSEAIVAMKDGDRPIPTAEGMILNPIRGFYRPNAELALDVFEKYKIFDSIDIKA